MQIPWHFWLAYVYGILLKVVWLLKALYGCLVTGKAWIEKLDGENFVRLADIRLEYKSMIL